MRQWWIVYCKPIEDNKVVTFFLLESPSKIRTEKNFHLWFFTHSFSCFLDEVIKKKQCRCSDFFCRMTLLHPFIMLLLLFLLCCGVLKLPCTCCPPPAPAPLLSPFPLSFPPPLFATFQDYRKKGKIRNGYLKLRIKFVMDYSVTLQAGSVSADSHTKGAYPERPWQLRKFQVTQPVMKTQEVCSPSDCSGLRSGGQIRFS